MGHKVHPYGFRLGITKDWQAKWFAAKRENYINLLHEDLKIRQIIAEKTREGGVARVEIERHDGDIAVTIHSARPGIVIGRGGQHAEEIRTALEKATGRKTRLSIREVDQPETVAVLIARSVADQIERRVAYRRAMKQAVFRATQAGVKGIKITCAGRLAGAEIARRETVRAGRLPLQTLRADIDYGFAEAVTVMGRIGVKVWVYKGDILPETVRKESATTETSKVPENISSGS
ncbi:MAG: 30S ribosomal protein S3 [Dehalococcoidia bacterium]|nr:30S ribosomal protein S3 [Dehalococcoidia bacterium]